MVSHTEVAHGLVMIHFVTGCYIAVVIHILVEDWVSIVIHIGVADHRMMTHVVVMFWSLFQRWYLDPISRLHKTHHNRSFVFV